jgi:hypothetical protein
VLVQDKVVLDRGSAQGFEVSVEPIQLHISGLGVGLLALAGAALERASVPLSNPELVVPAIAIAVAVHEAAHALAAKALGAKSVRLGLAKAGKLVVGLSVSVGEPMPVERWLLVALAPLLTLSPLLLALARAGGPLAPLLAWTFLFNAVGSGGDAVLAWIVASAGRGVVRDLGDRLSVEAPPPRLWTLALLDAVALWLLASLAAALLLLFLLALLDVSRLELAGLLVAEKVATEEQTFTLLSLRVGSGVPVLTAAAVAAFEAVAGRRRAEGLLRKLAARGAPDTKG